MQDTVAIVGLGYVGLPLAVAFGRRGPTIGFDINERKLESYRIGVDPSGEVESEALVAATELELTSDASRLRDSTAVIVVVPTPIDRAKQPDLGPLRAATRVVAENLRPGAVVIFESTVYPGCTEEVCVPLLEQYSGLRWRAAGAGSESSDVFSVAYSPERINPGDKQHRLENIVKVVSGDEPETLQRVALLYERIVEAGVYRAASIRVAEAAKVIENTQRDLNIALMNELAMIFDVLNIDTLDVLTAAGTKWNFLPFRPGLVGGHCIGVDPYYLTYKAESCGFYPQVVLGGRKTNDDVGRFIAETTVKQLARSGKPITGSTVAILGLTFKEDCPDIRNSRVPDILRELRAYGCTTVVHDPMADGQEALQEYGIELVDLAAIRARPADAIVLAVPHRDYKLMGTDSLLTLVEDGGVIVDVKGVVDRSGLDTNRVSLWRL